MKNYVIEVNRSRKILIKFFKKFNINVFGKYSNTVLIEFPNEHLAQKIVKKLYTKKYIVRFMKFNNNFYIRLTLSGQKNNQKLPKKKLARF